MYGEVCSLVAQGNVVSDQLSSGRIVSQLEPAIPSIVHEHTGPSEDWACHLEVHISINVYVVTLVVGLQLSSFVPEREREKESK